MRVQRLGEEGPAIEGSTIKDGLILGLGVYAASCGRGSNDGLTNPVPRE